jgi:hypothetical protein
VGVPGKRDSGSPAPAGFGRSDLPASGGLFASSPPPSCEALAKQDRLFAVPYRTITCPLSATSTCPVIVRARSEQRKTTASAMSWPVISRRSAVLFT